MARFMRPRGRDAGSGDVGTMFGADRAVSSRARLALLLHLFRLFIDVEADDCNEDGTPPSPSASNFRRTSDSSEL